MIICAAIKIQMKNLDEPTIVPCFRHGNGFAILRDLVQDRNAYGATVQGFINHKGEFLDREEAYIHALECGQINAHDKQFRKERNWPNELYSEDLY